MWKGIVGMGFRPSDFKDYVHSLTPGAWRPQFVVLHNTSSPRLSQWHSTSGGSRMKNLESYYRDQMGWSAGPHLFVADDLIWAFTPLTMSGVHSPSWNAISWGVEMVGEYEEEPFSPAVRANTIDALATIHLWQGVDPEALRFHKEDPETDHTTCPGRNVDKSDILARLRARIAELSPGEHLASRRAEETPKSAPAAAGPGQRRSVNINATEFGGKDDSEDSAYGTGPIVPTNMEVALPAFLPLGQRKVRIFNSRNGMSVDAVVRDIGPWNLHDAYWNGTGRPKSEGQYRNGTVAENGRIPSNDAGIDMTPAVFDALGIPGTEDTRQMHIDWTFIG